MKNWLFVFILLPVLSGSVFAQHPMLDQMTVQQEGTYVFINWTISIGETCNGIKIERAVNSSMFEQIGFIDGECGNPGFAVSYSFTDFHPVANAYNIYRLDLGGRGYTDEVSVFYVNTKEKGYVLSSNPILPDTKLYINNPRAENWILKIYRSNGQIDSQRQTNSDFFMLNSVEFNSGLYLFSISNGTQIFSGKFVVI
ncbi:MAG: T9SS type A sorting domain-containing protein [Flavobacteriales bacterium]